MTGAKTEVGAETRGARRGRRPKVLLITLMVAVLLIGVAAVLVVRAVPEYRTAFLIDASLPEDGADFTAITRAVGSAAANSADGDSLSLRRFGGACGDKGNTASVVGPGTGRARRIGSSASALKPSGKATLESGILAAIGDFSGYYPFRGSERNRIIVVTSRGTDACAKDQAALRRAVRGKARDSGVRLDFRLLGYKVPKKERRPLAQLADTIEAPSPRFASTPAELTTTLKELTVPPSKDAKHVTAPSATAKTPAPPPAPLADGMHHVYIRRIDVRARTLTVDEYEYLSGEEARKAAQEDGDFTGYDVYSRNPSKKTVEVRAAPNAVVNINQLTRDPQVSPAEGRNVTLAKLAELHASSAEGDRTGFELTMTGGQVTGLREVWHP